MTQSRTGNRFQRKLSPSSGYYKTSVVFLYSPRTTLMMGAESSSKTLENINQSTCHNIPEDKNLQHWVNY